MQVAWIDDWFPRVMGTGVWRRFQSIKYLRSHAMWSEAPESMSQAVRSNGPLELAAAVWRAYLMLYLLAGFTGGSTCAVEHGSVRHGTVRHGTMVILVRTNDLSNKTVKKHPKLTNTAKTRRYAALKNSKNSHSHSLSSASQSALKQTLSSRGRLLLPVAINSLISAARVGSFWTAAMLACAIAAKSLRDAGAGAYACACGPSFFICSAFMRVRHSCCVCPVLAQYQQRFLAS